MADNSNPPDPPPSAAAAPEFAKKVRRFAPEPLETTVRSSKKMKEDRKPEPDLTQATTEKKDFAGKRRFSPTPIETTFKSSRKAADHGLPTPEPTPRSITRSTPAETTPKPRRRFTPELIETSKRSKRANIAGPATLPTDKTDLTPGVPNIYTLRPKRTDDADAEGESATGSHNHIVPRVPRKQGSMRPHLNTRRSTRHNLFQPELGAIESLSSEEESEEDVPSLTNPVDPEEESRAKLQLARTRESCDDRFSGYLLALAAKAAEKQLREQALAAFPNESFRETVEHFYDREIEGQSDEESVEGIGMLLDDTKRPEALRRQSTEVGWAFKEMQEHQEKLNRQREEETNKKLAAEASQPTFKDPFWTNGQTEKQSPFHIPSVALDKQKEAELKFMRSAASPPMLGSDFKFRMCLSPKATKFESDQRIDEKPNRSDSGGGLWGGYCVTEEADQYLSPAIKGPPMIQTPSVEKEDPFSFQFGSDLPKGAKSPTGTKSPRQKSGLGMLTGLDERLKIEMDKTKKNEALLREFDDTFVTQVYNYLSLGYPVIARQYDHELAKISQIAESELCADDVKKNAKGYIGINDPTNGTKSSGQKDKHAAYCVRWKALRIYILEWARQHPSMANDQPAWGVRARRGSWAI
ncbi:hypothetical protein BJ878DRAFT_276599 [Calycina marina]|uniref:Uncharacterized protein n=1 Tax=Calycina marina TaxID=1763456 RepID=A0A9P8CBK2_9HELO|nr:hypothetical protein BJ878DRAFT_276599 [Calycina marina]